MNKKLDEIRDKYKYEISSIRKLAAQINDLHKWLLNTSLASLAFTFTVMFQIKGDNSLPNTLLAEITIATLFLAMIISLIIRGKNEFEGFIVDSRIMMSFIPVLREELIMHATDSDPNIKQLDELIDYSKTLPKNQESIGVKDLRLVIILPLSGGLLLVAGLCSLSLYIWMYLF